MIFSHFYGYDLLSPGPMSLDMLVMVALHYRVLLLPFSKTLVLYMRKEDIKKGFLIEILKSVKIY